MSAIVLAAVVMLGLSLLFCTLLGVAQVKLAVEEDPRQAALEAALPQANCGGCGQPSCSAYARAVLEGRQDVNCCTVGGPPVAERLAALMGVKLEANYPMRPVIHCGAHASDRLQQGHYLGEPNCSAAHAVGGVMGCAYGCLGFGDCVESCDHDAMRLVDGLPVIDYDHCIGCGDCVRACPRHLIEQIPFKRERMLVVACANHDPGKAVREVCRVGCVGCGACSRLAPELFHIGDNLAELDYSHYQGTEELGKVIEKCPMESLIEFGRPLPEHLEELANVEVGEAARKPEPAARPTAHDLDWRG